MAVLGYLWTKLPDIENYTYTPDSQTGVFSSDGVQIGEITDKNATYVTADKIPDKLIKAVVSVEDKRFYKHFGVDPRGILRALWRNYRAGEIVEGGSTITQQVAKLLFFDTTQSYSRKLKEALTAIRLEFKYSKEEIITIYLNEIYMGGGAYGVYEAAEVYFGKPPLELSLSQCATLAGIIQAPSAYCPQTEEGYTLAMQRRDKVLGLMLEQEMISREEYEAALAEVIVVVKPQSDEATFGHGYGMASCRAFLAKAYLQAEDILTDYFVAQMSYSQAQARQSAKSLLYYGNLTIKTTLNYAMQKNAAEAVLTNVTNRNSSAACSLVSMDAQNGNVLCYWGADNLTQLDMADSPRQCGSTMKPLYMLYLLEAGLAQVNSIAEDTPIKIGDYTPKNSGGKYMGYVTMRETLVNSLNAASLRFFSLANIRDEVNFVKEMGFESLTEEDYNYSFALGGLTKGVSTLEMAGAYGIIANGGTLHEGNFIISIEDSSGNIIFPEKQGGKKMVSALSCEAIKSALTSVVIRGTGKAASPGYVTFGKTGTTDKARDVWFCGATGNVVTCIWVGDIDSNYISSLSTKWPMGVYKQSIEKDISEGVFPDYQTLKKRRGEATETIEIIKPGEDGEDGITAEEVASLVILSGDEDSYADIRVVKCSVCKAEGNLATENCPAEYIEEKYFFQSKAPQSPCTSNHRHSPFDEGGRWWRELFGL